MAFQVFTAYGAASRPEATLRASGYLFLSRGVMKRAGSEDATHCELLFDEDNLRLGVRLYNNRVDEFEEGSLRELMREKSGTAVSLMPLLRFYGLPKPSKKHGLPVSFHEDGMMIMSLKEMKTAEDDIPF